MTLGTYLEQNFEEHNEEHPLVQIMPDWEKRKKRMEGIGL